MSQFIFNPEGLDAKLFGQDREAQWKTYLKYTDHVSDAEVAINEATLSYNRRADQSDQILKEGMKAQADQATALHGMLEETQQAQAEQAAALQGAITEGMGNLQEGMEGLQDQMVDVESAVYTAATAQIMDARRNAANIVGAIEEGSERIGRALSDNLGMLIDQQRVGNLLSRNIAELLRVPDFQKERLYFMEQGFKHYKNAALDPSMMEDALENLLKAEEREKSDYITLQRLGMIYLYSPAHVDAAKAEDYFLRAGRYAVVESDPEAARLALVLTGRLDEELADQQADPAHVKRLASDIYQQAALACYIQGKFSDAVTHAQKAAELSPGNLLPLLKSAKYLAADNRIENSVKLLEQAIRQDRDISVLAAEDPDLATKAEVTTLLERLRDEAALLLDEQITKLEAMNSPLLAPGEVFFDDFAKIKQLRQHGRYLELMTGLDAVKRLPDRINEELEARRIIEEQRLEQEGLEAEAKRREEEKERDRREYEAKLESDERLRKTERIPAAILLGIVSAAINALLLMIPLALLIGLNAFAWFALALSSILMFLGVYSDYISKGWDEYTSGPKKSFWVEWAYFYKKGWGIITSLFI